ncbi:hypothetical protein V2A60_005892 [Cordyceps javanica]
MQRHILTLSLFLALCLAELIPRAPVRRQNETDAIPMRLSSASSSDLERARQIVAQAADESAARNKARIASPARNKYRLDPRTKDFGDGATSRLASTHDAPALLNITEEIRDAAALVAEADALEHYGNGTDATSRHVARADKGKWWMGQLDHGGGWPWGNNPSDFKVFRNVKDYGAVGDGKADDTKAIISAVTAGKACGPGCYSSTTKGAIIYFPPGAYLVSSTIETYYGTQFIGDAVDRPTIIAAPRFIGLGVISTNHYVPNGGTGSDGNAKQWFINTANFYRQIRNFKIDISRTREGGNVAAIHYQVAQATSLQFVDFIASKSSSTTQQAIFAENGSGGFMSDLTFEGGQYGVFGGTQQFTSQRLTFRNVRTAVQLIWDWGWVWKSIRMENCEVGFKLMGEGETHNTGSIMVVDSIFSSVGTTFLTYVYKGEKGDATTGITLDNVKFDNVNHHVWDGKKEYLEEVKGTIDTWVQGRVYSGTEQRKALATKFDTKRDKTLVEDEKGGLPKAVFFEKTKPQYQDYKPDTFIHMRKSCKGDGKTDDTACFQRVLDNAGSSSIVYVDAGTYMISDTITVPKDVKIVGEVWSQIAAFGRNFGDAKSPRPLFKVGQPDEMGSAQMQDLLFTNKGNTPGVIFVQWNVRAAAPGKAGMWDCHVRVGGAVGTELESKQCPASTKGSNSGCNAGSALMHITKSGSGYFENVWLWVADHDIDDPDWDDDNNFMTQCSVYVSRGLLVESQYPVWLYGTSSEHAIMYQYQFYKARHVYASMIQTESPYYQPNPRPPAPIPDATCSGRNTVGCDASWAIRVVESQDITIHGAGLYSWFDTYTQKCVDKLNCQLNLIQFQKNKGGVSIHNLVTIGSANMIEYEGKIIKADENLAVDFHPYWSQIAVFDDRQVSGGTCKAGSNDTWINPYIRKGEYNTLRVLAEEEQLVYLTIVNGCPDEFEFRGGNDWQMDPRYKKEFFAVPAGESVQFLTQMETLSAADKRSDTAGEAYYRIGKTDKKASLKAKGTDVGTEADLGWPSLSYDRGLTNYFVLTGSEELGYYSSVNPPVSWMQELLPILGDRKLKHICMPGSHDSGMSELTLASNLANEGNTRNQYLDIYGQLLRGARWFDIRPCAGGHEGSFTCHMSVWADNSNFASTQGGRGLRIDTLIEQINQFMDEHPGELVILDINDEAGFNTGINEARFPTMKSTDWTPILDKFKNNIQKPCRGLPPVGPKENIKYLTDLTLNDYIGDGKGCVLSVARQSIPGVTTDSTMPDRGYYHRNLFPTKGEYSNVDSAAVLAQDQISKLTLNKAIKIDTELDTFFVLHWEPSLTFGTLTDPIHAQATDFLSAMFWYAYHQFTPYSYPNVLYTDAFAAPYQLAFGWSQEKYREQTQGHMAALAMAVNIAIASQNCHVTGK